MFGNRNLTRLLGVALLAVMAVALLAGGGTVPRPRQMPLAPP